MREVIALDIGGTNLRCAIIDENYEIKKSITYDTKKDGVTSFLQQVETIINEIGINKNIIGISIGVPGKVRRDGLILEMPNIGIKNIPLGKYLTDKFNLTTYVRNDAEMAALAEGVIGSGKGFCSTFYFTISTGIGGALIRNKKIIVPSDEIGHSLVEFNGGLYEYERICSGKYLVDLCKLNNLDVKNAAEFFKLKGDGNENAVKVFNIWVNYVSKLIQFVKKYFEVDIIVLSGGVLKSSEYFLKELKEMNDNVIISKAKFDQTAGLIGAAYYAFNPQ